MNGAKSYSKLIFWEFKVKYNFKQKKRDSKSSHNSWSDSKISEDSAKKSGYKNFRVQSFKLCWQFFKVEFIIKQLKFPEKETNIKKMASNNENILETPFNSKFLTWHLGSW